MILSFVCSVFLCFCFYTESSPSYQLDRIMAGKPAVITDFPYQLSMEYDDGHNGFRHRCGAVIIHQSWAVTAAHCFWDNLVVVSEEQIRLRSGSSYKMSGGTLHNVIRIIIHPDHFILDYDVGLIKVSTLFQFSVVAQKILMASEKPSVGTPAVVSGWGHWRFLSEQLQQVTIYIVDKKICENSLSNYRFHLTRRMLCAGVPSGCKHSCQGDAGGPLVAGNRLVGILSFGLGCGKKGDPGIYTDVAAIRGWIISSIEDDSIYEIHSP